jgi:hypothetical protein
LRIRRDDHDNLVKNGDASVNDVQVTVCWWVKGPGKEGSQHDGAKCSRKVLAGQPRKRFPTCPRLIPALHY